MPKSEIWDFQMCITVLYWNFQLSLLHAKVGNLEFSNVMFSTDLQLSLLHAKVGNLEFSNVMLSTDLQLSLLHAKE